MWHLWVACRLGQRAPCWPCSACSRPTIDTEQVGPKRSQATREIERAQQQGEHKRGNSYATLSLALPLSLSRLLLSREAFRLRNDGSETRARPKWQRTTTKKHVGALGTCWPLQVAKKRVFLSLPPHTPFVPATFTFLGQEYIHLMRARVRFAWCATFAVGCSPSSCSPHRPQSPPPHCSTLLALQHWAFFGSLTRDFECP